MPRRTQLRVLGLLKRSYSTQHRFQPLECLDSCDLDTFRAQYFTLGTPVILRNHSRSISAIEKWFIPSNDNSSTKELNISYLEQYDSAIVPLELTRSTAGPGTPSGPATTTSFERLEAPLSLFLTFTSAQGQLDQNHDPGSETRLYLAQHSLGDLPLGLRTDLEPVPELVLKAGKGDIYGSSLWLGRPPTRTPLHRDPNPNLFLQLAGEKVVRLMRPEIGRAVYERIRQEVSEMGGDTVGSANIRGEEMMVGEEQERIEEAVWGDSKEEKHGEGEEGEEGWEAKLESGDALFIPLGWWHSVRGVGRGVTGSVNYWFR
ncbi:Clavaminate synthase-like protein [Delitschia confertaspora ATCC 74209]|uniref:Clavaminate synthase-like protein n=1 Tax=Delitschia confertaspora ATCC 74209 TaxID=1513339 RepID=A0A9P4JCA7_9PLEO|nr:Clavaminate synthase-like protein [Delitschia confertaspora ATCC 74209]